MKLIALAGIAILSLSAVAGCSAAPEEATLTARSKIDSRFNPKHPAPDQDDDWSCSVHTATWMLQATGHRYSWNDLSTHMQNTKRVDKAVGLRRADGSGLAQTLRELADGSPNIDSRASVTFDDVAKLAGHMAVGIGGNKWNHWSAVRGYDADKDVLVLANSAPEWMGAGQTLTRREFTDLGQAMAMVWMDYGQTPPPPPFEPSERPRGGEFEALHIKTSIGEGQWLTQCNESADGERVWQTTSGGPDPETRWAEAKYPQMPTASCGDPSADGIYPIVFRSANAGEIGAWVTSCTGSRDGYQAVYRTDAEVDGHPAAVFLYVEENEECR